MSGHPVGWVSVEGAGASCALVLGYVSIKPRVSQCVWVNREIQHSRHGTTGYKPRQFADLINSSWIQGIINKVLEKYRLTCWVTEMAESTAIPIKTIDGTAYKSRRFETNILLERKKVLGIANGTQEAPDANDGTELEASMKQHGIAWSTILLGMER